MTARKAGPTLGLALVLGSLLFGSWAVAAPDVSSEITASVTLSDDDRGRAMFDVANAATGWRHAQARCIRVTYSGNAGARVALSADAAPARLARFIRVRIARGRMTQGARFPSCRGFVADAANYSGEGPGILFRGTLSRLSTESQAMSTRWRPGETRVYRIVLTLSQRTPDTMQGKGARIAFRWTTD